jgi:hypothetical protein
MNSLSRYRKGQAGTIATMVARVAPFAGDVPINMCDAGLSQAALGANRTEIEAHKWRDQHQKSWLKAGAGTAD